MTPSVAIVILTWNARDLTLRCLDSIAQLTYPSSSVVLVDNRSADGTIEAVQDAWPAVEIVALESNRGFAGGVNAGFARALELGVDHVYLLNNDATVAPDALEPLVAAAADPAVGAACSQILHEGTGTIWYAGASYDPRRGHQGRHTGYGQPALPPDTAPFATDRACGGAMLVPRTVLDRVGGLDESLFAYVEDVDWSLRARRAGLSIVVCPASVVHHGVSAATGGASSPTSIYYALRNGLVVAERTAPLGPAGTARRRLEAVAAFTAQALGSRSRRAAFRAVLDGLRDARRGQLGRRER